MIAVNKWDGLEKNARERMKTELDRRLPFLDFAEMHFISALHGTGVGELYATINKSYASAMRKFSTPELTTLLDSLQLSHQPPLVRGRRIKLRYAHQGGKNPPIIVIHGNQVESIPNSYKRYLINGFRKHLKLEGTPVRIEFKGGENPYAGQKNVLSKRQIARKQRLVKFVKKREKRRTKKKGG